VKHNFKTQAFLLLIFALVGNPISGTPISASAQSAVLSHDGSQQGNRDSFTGTVGTNFLVLEDVQISALGYEDPGADGLEVAHRVGLWQVDGEQLLASVLVTPEGSFFQDGWQYINLPSILTLEANESYRIGAETFFGVDAWSDASDGGNGNPDFTLDEQFGFQSPPNVFAFSDFEYPGLNGGQAAFRWAPANALIVPEPNCLFVTAAVMLLGISKRRRV